MGEHAALEIEPIAEAVRETLALDGSSCKAGAAALRTLSVLASKLHCSSRLKKAYKALCKEHKCPTRLIHRQIATRWNYTTLAIKDGLNARPAIDTFLAQPRHKLTHLKISAEGWRILESLHKMLKDFIDDTKKLEASGRPLVHEVIRVIDRLTTHLHTIVRDDTQPLCVRAGATAGHDMLNKYYQKTDESIMYSFAIMLHPKFKLRYFAKHEWEQEWIDKAMRLLKEHYRTYIVEPEAHEESATDKQDEMSDYDDDSDAIINGESRAVRDAMLELHTFLHTDIIKTKDFDVIAYYVNQPDSPRKRMALDILTAAASSCDVERAFSRGGLMVSKYRHALKDESIRAGTVLSSWIRSGIASLLPQAALIAFIEGKSSRARRVEGGDA